MNHCLLSVEVVQAPQLRYTSDSQTPVADMQVQLPGLRENDPPTRLRLVGWGNLAQQMPEQYRVGDRLLVEGRLKMDTLDRPEGFKEKRAEIVASRIYRWGSDSAPLMNEPTADYTTPPATAAPTPMPAAPTTPAPAPMNAAPTADPDYDDIPF